MGHNSNGVGSARSTSVSTSPVVSTTPKNTLSGSTKFSCALCGKSFERRDLRDRHRRRCEKSIEKGQTPKKKSCTSCARSKVKCDLQIPACQRCLDRHTICEYPIDSTTAVLSQLHEETAAMNAANSDSYMTSPTGLSTPSMTMGNIPDGIGSIAADSINNMDWGSRFEDASAVNFWEMGPWNSTTESNVAPLSSLDYSWNIHTPQDNTNASFPDFSMSSDFGSISEPGDRVVLGHHEEPLSPVSSTLSGSDSVGAAFGGIKSTGIRKRSKDAVENGNYTFGSRPVASQSQMMSPISAQSQTHSRLDSPATYMQSPLGAPVTVKKPRPSTNSIEDAMRSHRSSISLPTNHIGRMMPAPNTGLFGFGEILNVICDYPQHMLRPNFWSPFVHHRHYRCSQGGLAEPIAIALCCISASRQSVESSNPFVSQMINDQREKLVHDFARKAENLEDAIAVLHAMCIYQIETILVSRSQSSPKPRSSNKDLYHHFLLQMTRRLCENHIQAVSLKDNTATSWECWTMAETIRRTAFLVDMVNELSYHSQSLDEIYYEPLQESLLRDMPLPAPERMWRAFNEEEWASARDASGWTGSGVMTLGMTLDRLDHGAGAFDDLYDRDGWRSGNTHHIAKLIVSSAKHLKRH